MRTIIITLLAGASVAVAQTNLIQTLDGRVYPMARVQRADPDGLVIQYQPEEGGVGVAKLKFQVLPEEIRQRYGCLPEKAKMFEQNQARGNATRIATEEQRKRDAELAVLHLRIQRQLEEMVALEKADKEAKARKQQEDQKAQKAQEAALVKQQKDADEAFMQRWRIQDNQLEGIQRSLENISRDGVGVRRY